MVSPLKMTRPLFQHPDIARAAELLKVFFYTDSDDEREDARAEALDRLAMVEGAND